MEDIAADEKVREVYPTSSIFKVETREANKRPRLASASSNEGDTILMIDNQDTNILGKRLHT